MSAQSPSAGDAARFHAWNPGLASDIPRELLGMSTIFRADNVFTSLATATELQGVTGLAPSELVAFRPERLALHELLIRVTADFVVPDGSRIEDLGINFRRIITRILKRHVTPQLPAIAERYAQARRALQHAIEAAMTGTAAITSRMPPAIACTRPGIWSRRRRTTETVITQEGRWGAQQIAELEAAAGSATDAVHELACRTLSRVMTAFFKMHGGPWGTRELILSVATDIASNVHCSEAIGIFLEPILRSAALQDAYGLLPGQERPVIINTKGPSASGKSTLRPLQRSLAAEVGVNWRDFALISPDIWRKQLLDYSSLGGAYKYAGAFTAEELQIIDQKLDRYMARKHQRGDMPHLLIDRFRFDSFATDSNEAGSNLLTRFGQTVHLFFMITPPDLLVERAWKRGLEFGRYKAVDDTLAHAVEAYSGMPHVFFTWVRRRDKQLQFEFLDNTVDYGERPRTMAFGDNATMNVLDVVGLCSIERYSLIDIGATSPAALYAAGAPAIDCHTKFVRDCIGEFRAVNFADQTSGRIYLRVEAGKLAWIDPQAVPCSAEVRAILRAVEMDCLSAQAPRVPVAQHLDGRTRAPMLGQWGTGSRSCADYSRKLQ
jgi:hypothetical protein